MATLRPAICLALLLPALLHAQLTTGFIEGRAPAGSEVVITAGPGFRATVSADASGHFAIALPAGRYAVSIGNQAAITVQVTANETTRLDLDALPPPPAPAYPEGLSREPATVTQPLNFGDLSDNRLAVQSQGAASWTNTLRPRRHGRHRFLPAGPPRDPARRRGQRAR